MADSIHLFHMPWRRTASVCADLGRLPQREINAAETIPLPPSPSLDPRYQGFALCPSSLGGPAGGRAAWDLYAEEQF